MPDGKGVDFIGTIKQRFEPDVPPEQNGFRKLFAEIGPRQYAGRFWIEPYWTDLCRTLDVDPNAPPVFAYISAFEWNETQRKLIFPDESVIDRDKAYTQLANDSWKIEEYPYMAEWATEHSRHVNSLLDSVKWPFFIVPLNEFNSSPREINFLYESMQLGALGRDLSTKARVFIAKGDFEAAWENTIACFRFACHQNDSFINSARFLSASCFGSASSLAKEILVSSDFDEQLLLKFKSDLESLPKDRFDIQDHIFVERLLFLNLIQNISNEKSRDVLNWGEGSFRLLGGKTKYAVLAGINWNAVAIKLNSYIDRLAKAHQEPQKEERNRLLKELEVDVALSRPKSKDWKETVPWASKHILTLSRSEILAKHFFNKLSFDIRLINNRYLMQQSQIDVIQTAIALERFRLQEGRYPAVLGELVPMFLAKIPSDPFAEGGQFKYTLDEQATGYMLKNVGGWSIVKRNQE